MRGASPAAAGAASPGPGSTCPPDPAQARADRPLAVPECRVPARGSAASCVIRESLDAPLAASCKRSRHTPAAALRTGP